MTWLPDRTSVVRARLRQLDIDDRNLIPGVEVRGDGRISIACGDGVHTAHVDGDDLLLDDHDVEAELTILALGADLPSCLIYVAVWEDAFRSPGFLDEWADDVEGHRLRASDEEWRGNYWESWPSEPPAARVLFGPHMQHVLAMRVARRGVARPECQPALQRAIQARARRAFVESLAAVDAHRRPDALVPVTIALEDSGAPRVTGRLAQTESEVDIRLRPDWLWTVWADHLAVIDGRFVVARDGDRVETVVWRPTGGPDGEHVPGESAARVPKPAALSSTD